MDCLLRSRLFVMVCLLSGSALLLGCPGDSDEGASGSGTTGNTTAGGNTEGGGETKATTGAADDVPETDVEDDATTTGGGDASGTTTGEQTGEETGGNDFVEDIGEACDNNEQCISGFCLPGPDGKVCTQQCITSCPDEWECEAVTNFGGDLTYVCVPQFVALCSTCEKDSDCGGSSSRCIEMEPEGNRCARTCSGDDPCPGGYLCQATDDLTNLCVPTTGSCICSAAIIDTQQACEVENGFGVCGGAITCAGPGGWTDCDADIPGPEVCDGKDNNCDGNTDEGTEGGDCKLTNEFGSCAGTVHCNGNGGPGCTAKEPTAEACDGTDNNCNGAIDEANASGCTTFYEDVDKDGFGSSSGTQCLCNATGNYTAGTGGDCNDLNPSIGAGKPEICNNLDDDCDGNVDGEGAIGCVVYFADEDGDGTGVVTDAKCLCSPAKQYTALISGDCDDDNPQAFPGNAEKCNDIDDNCNSIVDEANAIWCEPYLKDEDGDGFGVTSLFKCMCKPDGIWSALTPGDCNDKDPKAHPGGVEICDGIDNSCNGVVDEDCDKDSDGYCNALKPVIGNPFSCPLGGGDCVDFDPDVNPGAAEVCDKVDNDCDTLIDEDVLAPCGGCAPVCLMGAGPESEVPFEDAGEFFDGAGTDDNGYIVLDSSTIQLNMIWVSNSGEGSVSKINTSTGAEVARYKLCKDPSRTSVDALGDVWVACRGDAKVVKIALSPDTCTDLNGNGVVETSTDVNGDGVIQAGEMMAEGTDECVLFTSEPGGNAGAVARAMAIDAENNGWVGMWNTKKLFRIDGTDGKILQTIDIPTNPYGLAIAQNGILWIAGRGTNQLVKVDPANNSAQGFAPGGSYSPYGMTIDENGRIWTANCCSDHAAMRFDPTNNSWVKVPVNARPRGIAANGNGFVFVANDQSDLVHKIDINTNTVVGTTNLGGGRFPVGMAVDFDGKVWAINQSTSSATRIEPSDMSILFETKTGPSPYTYSDMTGFQQKTIVAPKGTYRHVFKGWAEGTTQWMQVSIELFTPPGTSAELRVRVADEVAELDGALWTPFFGPFPPELPNVNLSQFGAVIGKFMEVEVQLFSEDALTTPILKSVDIVAAEFN